MTKGIRRKKYKYIEKECKCPDPKLNDACINNNENIEEVNQTTKISINTASIADLMTLPGIGESKAKSIIDYRNNNDYLQVLMISKMFLA